MMIYKLLYYYRTQQQQQTKRTRGDCGGWNREIWTLARVAVCADDDDDDVIKVGGCCCCCSLCDVDLILIMSSVFSVSQTLRICKSYNS